MFVRMSKRTLAVTGIGRQQQKQQSQLLRQILMLSTDSEAANSKCVESSNKARRKLPTGGPGISQFITDLGRFRK